jgi:hypothetical protein
LALALAALLGPAARADDRPNSGVVLLMVDDAGCIYCRRWDAEVGVGYPKSAEGQFAPLVRRPLRHPDLSGFGNIRYTPTFLVVINGAELGRIVGYPGAEFFYARLDAILAKAGFTPETQPEDRPEPRPEPETLGGRRVLFGE